MTVASLKLACNNSPCDYICCIHYGKSNLCVATLPTQQAPAASLHTQVDDPAADDQASVGEPVTADDTAAPEDTTSADAQLAGDTADGEPDQLGDQSAFDDYVNQNFGGVCMLNF